MPRELDWEEQYDPLYGSPIIIPENILLWRGYDIRYDSIPDRFSYYSSAEVAYEYAKQANRELGCFQTTRALRVLDVRTMANIVERIIQQHSADAYLNDFASSVISFGLCSLNHQITLLKERYRESLKMNTVSSRNLRRSIQGLVEISNPSRVIEQKGVRVAETENDAKTMGFLQELFRGLFDGILSPRLETPFHIEKNGTLHPELILFSPKSCNVRQLKEYPSNVSMVSITQLIQNKHQLVNIRRIIRAGEPITVRMYMPLEGGATNKNTVRKRHYMTDVDDKLNRKDTAMCMMYKEATEAGKRWRRYITVVEIDDSREPLQLSEFREPYIK